MNDEWKVEKGIGTALLKLLYIFTIGAFLCVTMICMGLMLCCTIIGIPFGVTCFAIGFKLLAPPF